MELCTGRLLTSTCVWLYWLTGEVSPNKLGIVERQTCVSDSFRGCFLAHDTCVRPAWQTGLKIDRQLSTSKLTTPDQAGVPPLYNALRIVTLILFRVLTNLSMTKETPTDPPKGWTQRSAGNFQSQPRFTSFLACPHSHSLGCYSPGST